MNIYEFVNSRDIREHWEHSGYKPSPLEMAWLIWQSKNHTLLQKHSAYWTLIDNTEDGFLPVKSHNIMNRSLHSFLKRYMELELHLLSLFYKNETDVVYTYGNRTHIYDYEWSEQCFDSAFFMTFDEASAYASEQVTHHIRLTDFAKTYVCGKERHIFLRCKPNGDPLYFEEKNILCDEDDYNVFNNIWKSLYFNFPTPFKTGDILKTVRGKYGRGNLAEEVFALTNLCTESECADYFSKNGDGSDMTAHGYFLERDGHIYHECVHDYMNLERVPTELARRERMLVPISRYLKGEMDLALLLGAHKIMCYEQLIAETKVMLNYTAEGFALAGIIEKKKI